MILGIKRINVRLLLVIGGIVALALGLRLMWKGRKHLLRGGYYPHLIRLMKKVHQWQHGMTWRKLRK
jgi:hypothetical protein